jgi:hypothetical protein
MDTTLIFFGHGLARACGGLVGKWHVMGSENMICAIELRKIFSCFTGGHKVIVMNKDVVKSGTSK